MKKYLVHFAFLITFFTCEVSFASWQYVGGEAASTTGITLYLPDGKWVSDTAGKCLYRYRLEIGNKHQIKKMLLLK